MMIPGRILVIDDREDEVEKVVDSLRNEGENVTYTASVPDDKFLGNVRLLITDLYLVANDKEQSYEVLASLFEKISKKTTFFVIAIWTKYARNVEEDQRILEDLQRIYKERTKTNLKAAFLAPFGKEIPQIELVSRIKSLVSSRPDCGLLYEIERIVENARDLTVTDIMNAESIPTILKALKREVGEAGLGRQMVELFLKVLARHSKANEAMEQHILNLVGADENIMKWILKSAYGPETF
jgi:CheY-like chemotaxis protein